MRTIAKVLMLTVVMGVGAGTLTSCKKKIYLDTPEMKEGQEIPPDPEAESTEKRVPYVVDEEVRDMEYNSTGQN